MLSFPLILHPSDGLSLEFQLTRLNGNDLNRVVRSTLRIARGVETN